MMVPEVVASVGVKRVIRAFEGTKHCILVRKNSRLGRRRAGKIFRFHDSFATALTSGSARSR